jgi:hypothetical protein
MEMYSGPHQRSWGKRLANRIRTIVRSAVDQFSDAPIGVADQSIEETSSAISPPAGRKSSAGLVERPLGITARLRTVLVADVSAILSRLVHGSCDARPEHHSYYHPVATFRRHPKRVTLDDYNVKNIILVFYLGQEVPRCIASATVGKAGMPAAAAQPKRKVDHSRQEGDPCCAQEALRCVPRKGLRRQARKARGEKAQTNAVSGIQGKAGSESRVSEGCQSQEAAAQ